MEESLKLATQVVLLLAAVIGLYKGAKIATKGASLAEGRFSSFLAIANVLGSILLFPAFIMLFIGIISIGISVASKADSQPPVVNRLDSLLLPGLQQDDSSQLMIHGANLMTSFSERDKTLEGSVLWSLRAKRFALAVAEASAITDRGSHDRTLAMVTDTLLKYRFYSLAIKSASAIVDIDDRDKKLRYVIRSAERHGFP